MLADEEALTDVLGYTVTRQPDPETISDPKKVCAGLLADSRDQMAQREMYARIARCISIQTLASRCSCGFKPFAERVQRVFGCDPFV
jgi:hypothetical protein